MFGAFHEACLTRKRETGFSRHDLGERIDKDKTGVSKLLKGPGNWTLKTLSDFANALDLDVKVALFDRKFLGRYFDRTGLHFEDFIYKSTLRNVQDGGTVLSKVENKPSQQAGPKKISNGYSDILTMTKVGEVYGLSMSNRVPPR